MCASLIIKSAKIATVATSIIMVANNNFKLENSIVIKTRKRARRKSRRKTRRGARKRVRKSAKKLETIGKSKVVQCTLTYIQ